MGKLARLFGNYVLLIAVFAGIFGVIGFAAGYPELVVLLAIFIALAVRATRKTLAQF